MAISKSVVRSRAYSSSTSKGCLSHRAMWSVSIMASAPTAAPFVPPTADGVKSAITWAGIWTVGSASRPLDAGAKSSSARNDRRRFPHPDPFSRFRTMTSGEVCLLRHSKQGSRSGGLTRLSHDVVVQDPVQVEPRREEGIQDGSDSWDPARLLRVHE